MILFFLLFSVFKTFTLFQIFLIFKDHFVIFFMRFLSKYSGIHDVNFEIRRNTFYCTSPIIALTWYRTLQRYIYFQILFFSWCLLEPAWKHKVLEESPLNGLCFPFAPVLVAHCEGVFPFFLISFLPPSFSPFSLLRIFTLSSLTLSFALLSLTPPFTLFSLIHSFAIFFLWLNLYHYLIIINLPDLYLSHSTL